ncbi:MAG TPA: SlyX family protein [Paracoccaceae bacterium]|nr:SlyX family protein [Paracoccaceae bacterium]
MDRVERLEETVAHLARALEDLSAETARQGAEIDRLTRRLSMLLERGADREVSAGGAAPLADQKPPHW